MSRIDSAAITLHSIRAEALENRWLNRIYPLFKLLLTGLYIGMVTSVALHDWDILLSMGIYPLILFIAGDISPGKCIYRLRIALPLICMMGVFNVILERNVLFYMGILPVTDGMLHFLSLMVKGIYSLLAVYLLAVTTTVEKLCISLRIIHCPGVVVTVFLLIYRYISLLLEEAGKMVQAYHLRAPAQTGVAVQVWGSFVGMLLLRTYDRAEQIGDSMRLRGFQGEFLPGETMRITGSDWIFLILFAGILLVFRNIPVFWLVGCLVG